MNDHSRRMSKHPLPPYNQALTRMSHVSQPSGNFHTIMKKYIIEDRESGRLWQIRDGDNGTIVGTLNRRSFFTAESEEFRSVSNATDSLTCMRVVFRSHDFYHEV